jgi:coenzyme Q-binding protein COQ10
MPKASVKRSIECEKKQLIDLVLDVDKYPLFVPFCLDSKVHEKKEQGDLILMIADLTIGKGPLKDTYKSDVKYNKKDDTIFVTNLDGPLKHLENRWHFKQLNKTTEVSFEVDFELKNEFLNMIMTKSFQFGLDKIADSFEKRAEELFSKTQN